MNEVLLHDHLMDEKHERDKESCDRVLKSSMSTGRFYIEELG
jgi:hypothetical protein